jgi:hypothetical protein
MATAEEIDQHLADIGGGLLDLAAFPVVSAWAAKRADKPRLTVQGSPIPATLHTENRDAGACDQITRCASPCMAGRLTAPVSPQRPRANGLALGDRLLG